MTGRQNIEHLKLVEDRLNSCLHDGCSAELSLERQAKVTLLKYLQVQTVKQYERAYDDLYYSWDREGRLACISKILTLKPDALVQPKILLDYHEDAEIAKERLDALIAELTENSQGCEAVYAKVKPPESTQRKAEKFCGGDISKIADIARVTVVCDTPDGLLQTHEKILECFQVCSS